MSGKSRKRNQPEGNAPEGNQPNQPEEGTEMTTTTEQTAPEGTEPTVTTEDGNAPEGNGQTATATAPATEETKPDYLAALDEVGKIIFDKHVALLKQRNEVATNLGAANQDENAVLVAMRDTNTDPRVVDLRERISDLLSQVYELETERDNILKPLASQAIADAKGNVDELKAKVAAFDKTIDAGEKYIAQVYGADVLKAAPDKVGKRRSSASASDGEKSRRVRGFDVTVNGTLASAPDAKGEQRSNLAAAAKVIGVDTSDLRQAFWDAAGTTDSAQYPDNVSFTFRKGDEAFEVVATKQAE